MHHMIQVRAHLTPINSSKPVILLFFISVFREVITMRIKESITQVSIIKYIYSAHKNYLGYKYIYNYAVLDLIYLHNYILFIYNCIYLYIIILFIYNYIYLYNYILFIIKLIICTLEIICVQTYITIQNRNVTFITVL